MPTLASPWLVFLSLVYCSTTALAQTTYTWTLNNSGAWNTMSNWGGSGSPSSLDTAQFSDINSPVAAGTIGITDGQSVRNVSFLNGNAVTHWTIGGASQVLVIANSSLGTISRAGAANTTFASNISVAGSNRDFLVNNTNANNSLNFQTINVGATNIAEFAGVGTTNVATLTSGNIALMTGSGAKTINNVNNFTTVTLVSGTNNLNSVGSVGTINLNGGTNTIGSITGGVVNVNGGTNSISNVSGGTQVNVGGSLSTGITLASGANLTGTGTINGNVIFNGGHHSPGNSPGTQTINGNITYNNGSTFNWELDGNTTNVSNFDRIFMNGGVLSFNGNVTTNLNLVNVDFTNAFWLTNQTWTVYSNTGIVNGLANNMIVGGIGAPGSFSWQQSGNNLNLQFTFSPTAVPEPASLALITLFGASMGLARCFRSRVT